MEALSGVCEFMVNICDNYVILSIYEDAEKSHFL